MEAAKQVGGRRLRLTVAAGLLVVLSVLAAPAGAGDDLDGYVDRVANVSLTNRSYDPETEQTTFTFVLELESGTDSVSHIVIAACREPATVVSSSGPPATNGAVADPDPSTEHDGAKFEPGYPGRYEVTFAGSPRGAEFIVKNGNGHKHYLRSSCFETVAPPTSSSTTTVTTAPVPTTEPTATTTTTTTTRPSSGSTPTTATPDAARLEQCERQAKNAKVIYEPEREMTVGESSKIRVEASVKGGNGQNSGTIFGSPTTVVTVKLRCEVQAQLRGRDFDIDPKEFQEDSFLDRPQIVWAWDVTPKRTGDAVLTLEIKSIADIGGRTLVGTSRSYEARITVKAKPQTVWDKTQRVSNSVVEHPLVQGLGSLLLVLGTLASVWRWLMKRPWPWKQPGGGEGG